MEKSKANPEGLASNSTGKNRISNLKGSVSPPYSPPQRSVLDESACENLYLSLNAEKTDDIDENSPFVVGKHRKDEDDTNVVEDGEDREKPKERDNFLNSVIDGTKLRKRRGSYTH